MSIENTLERIAVSLEKIAKSLEHTEKYEDRTTFDVEGPVTAAAVPSPTPTPTPARLFPWLLCPLPWRL